MMVTRKFKARGQRLWESLLARDAALTDEENPSRITAVSACRAADRLEGLETQCLTEPPTIQCRNGATINPVWAECRNQAMLMARLLAALRIPDEKTGKRSMPTRVVRMQQPTALSALERARAAKSG
jgi:hypothetical protein